MKKYRITSLDGITAEISVPEHAPQDVHEHAVQGLINWQRSQYETPIKTDYWEPIGGICVESGSFVTIYYQAMVLTTEN